MIPSSKQRWLIMVPATVWIVWASSMTLGNRWSLFADNWFMTATMCLGSFIAGATSEGGGAVAFPVMTLGFGIDPHIARDFSLMIQSIGMTAAAVLIVGMGIRVEWKAILYASIGGTFGIGVGLELLSPHLPSSIIKMFFTSLWLSFGLTLYWLDRNPNRKTLAAIASWRTSDAWLLSCVGFAGGIVSGLTGSGLDIMTFSLLTLYFQVSERIATPTSVVLMAINAVVGAAWRCSSWNTPIATQAWDYWFVCVPVVVVGAPIGAYLIHRSTKRLIVRFLLCSIVAQFVGALLIVPQSMRLLLFSTMTMTVGLWSFRSMVKLGATREGRRLSTNIPSGSFVPPAPKLRTVLSTLNETTKP